MRIRGVGKEPGEIQETQTKAGYEGKLRAVKISFDWKVCLSAPGVFLFQIFYIWLSKAILVSDNCRNESLQAVCQKRQKQIHSGNK